MALLSKLRQLGQVEVSERLTIPNGLLIENYVVEQILGRWGEALPQEDHNVGHLVLWFLMLDVGLCFVVVRQCKLLRAMNEWIDGYTALVNPVLPWWQLELGAEVLNGFLILFQWHLVFNGCPVEVPVARHVFVHLVAVKGKKVADEDADRKHRDYVLGVLAQDTAFHVRLLRPKEVALENNIDGT